MITARPQKNLKQAKEYFREHLAQGDYYSEGHAVHGRWFGRGVGRLGLDPKQPVTEEAFVRLCENLHPVTGEQLTVRRRQVDRRVLYDFTVSAPKSVSIMAITMQDTRILEAHDAACQIALTTLEESAATRVRAGGQQTERVTGELVACSFRHESSRALDPQLHDHFVAFNCTWDPKEKRWKALQTSLIFERMTFYTEVYRAELAARLAAMGYRIRKTDHGFEVEGVSQDIIDRFSKRRRAILAEASRLEEELGHKLGNDALSDIAHSKRSRKMQNLRNEDLIAYQRAQLSKVEIENLERLKSPVSIAPSPIGPGLILDSRIEATPSLAAKESLDYATEHLFERKTVVQKEELLKLALVRGRARVTLPELLAEFAGRRGFIVVEGNLTTPEALKQERRMITLVNAGIGGCRAFNPSYRGSDDLNGEQQLALKTLLCSPDRVTAIRGHAGVGKTRMLLALSKAMRGQEIHLFAPTTSAVDMLRKSGFEVVETVQRLSVDENMQKRVARQVCIVDEAGLLSNGQMLELLEFVHARGGRLILCGDVRQHSSVQAGDALRILEDQSALRTVRVRSIQRQLDREYREAISELAEGKAMKALRRLDSIGAVQELEPDQCRCQMAGEYVSSVNQERSALVVCPTWTEIDLATEEIRPRLKAAGYLGSRERQFEVHRSLHWTLAQRRDFESYKKGLVLNFLKATRRIRSGETTEVIDVTKQRITVRRANGRKEIITRKQAGCYDVAKVLELPVAKGEKLLIQGNRRRQGLVKGQVVKVKEFRKDGSLVLDDGRKVPTDFRMFTHGYAVTSFASQSRTVDDIYVSVELRTGALNQKQFYVSVSRGRKKVKIFTDDRSLLMDAIQRTGARLSATELVDGHRESAKIRQAKRISLKV